MRLLLVEDERALSDQVAERLRAEGYAVDIARDGQEALYMGGEFPIDAALVDLGLPKLSGIDVIRHWRAAGRTFPILILTARGRWQEKVEGLDTGADDYLVKPFQFEELLARLQALIRRSKGWATPFLECGPVALNTASQSVQVNGTAVELTAFEYKVLEYLMLRAGEVISKSELSDHIYEEEADRDSNVIEVLVARLRKKLDPDRVLQPIETLRGRGYRFNLEPSGRTLA
jgi:two-component system, OmpR family, response regulator PhoP